MKDLKAKTISFWLGCAIATSGVALGAAIYGLNVFSREGQRAVRARVGSMVLAAAALLFAGAPVASAADNEIQISDYYNATSERKQWAVSYHLAPGIEQMSKGYFDGAFAEFEFILRYIPNHPRALSLLGDVALSTDRFIEADGYFRRAFLLYPKSSTASSYKDYGKFLYKAGHFTEAVEALTVALRKDPNMSEAHYYLGLSYCELKEFTRANQHAQFIYARDFPLTELKRRLIAVNAWHQSDAALARKRGAQDPHKPGASARTESRN